jgi:hypothetical protein
MSCFTDQPVEVNMPFQSIPARKHKSDIVTIAAAVLSSITMTAAAGRFARARRPSRAMIEANAKKRAKISQKRKQAAPWGRALKKALYSLLKKRKVQYPKLIIEHTFWITYKHYRPAHHTGRRLKKWALSFRKPWQKLIRGSKKLGVRPLQLARAIYKFTNSDYQPASCVDGQGQNKVRTAKQFLRWGQALLALGRRAKAAGKNPLKVWDRAVGARIATIASIKRLNVKRIPPAPKY